MIHFYSYTISIGVFISFICWIIFLCKYSLENIARSTIYWKEKVRLDEQGQINKKSSKLHKITQKYRPWRKYDCKENSVFTVSMPIQLPLEVKKWRLVSY